MEEHDRFYSFLFFSFFIFCFIFFFFFFPSSFFFSFPFRPESEGLRRDTGVVFCCYRDRIYIGDIILDDVVIRYAGIHDAAFDVNCEERRSRFCFIPRQFLLPNKDVQICAPVRRVARQIRSAYFRLLLISSSTSSSSRNVSLRMPPFPTFYPGFSPPSFLPSSAGPLKQPIDSNYLLILASSNLRERLQFLFFLIRRVSYENIFFSKNLILSKISSKLFFSFEIRIIVYDRDRNRNAGRPKDRNCMETDS